MPAGRPEAREPRGSAVSPGLPPPRQRLRTAGAAGHLAPNFPSRPTWGRGSRRLLPLSAPGRPAAARTTPSLHAAAPLSPRRLPPAPAAPLQTARPPRAASHAAQRPPRLRSAPRARPRAASLRSHTKRGSGGRALVPLSVREEWGWGGGPRAAPGHTTPRGLWVIPCRWDRRPLARGVAARGREGVETRGGGERSGPGPPHPHRRTQPRRRPGRPRGRAARDFQSPAQRPRCGEAAPD